jgi:hypothetical protein
MLTLKAKKFLSKMQQGGTFTNVPNFTNNLDAQGMTSSAMTLPLQTLPNGFENSLQKQQENLAANQQNLIQQQQSFAKNVDMQRLQGTPQQGTSAMDNAANLISPLIFGTGTAFALYNFYEANKAKKKQKRQEKFFKEDLEQRQKDVRLNEYTNTPYNNFQMGGQNDAFSAFYENQQQYNDDTQRAFEEYYATLNEQNKQITRDFRQKGISQLGQTLAVIPKALSMGTMQEGGEISNEEKSDIYSENFDAKHFLSDGQEGSLPSTPEEFEENNIKQQQSDALVSWIFEDEEEYYNPNPINEEYFAQSEVDSNLVPQGDVIANIGQNESGGDYSVINPTTGTTGKYQFHPKYWSSQIRDFMGLSTSTSRDQVMRAFQTSPDAQEKFMKHVVDNVYGPELPTMRSYGRKYGFTDDQLIKLMHYRGISDAKKRLLKGDFEVSAEEKSKYNNPDILEYLNK